MYLRCYCCPWFIPIASSLHASSCQNSTLSAHSCHQVLMGLWIEHGFRISLPMSEPFQGEGLHGTVLRSQEDPNPVSLNAFATCNVFSICSEGGSIGTPTGVRSSAKLSSWGKLKRKKKHTFHYSFYMLKK